MYAWFVQARALPHFCLYEVVSLHMCVLPCKYRKRLEMLLKLMELCELTGSRQGLCPVCADVSRYGILAKSTFTASKSLCITLARCTHWNMPVYLCTYAPMCVWNMPMHLCTYVCMEHACVPMYLCTYVCMEHAYAPMHLCVYGTCLCNSYFIPTFPFI